jgi:hypothetical protein
VAVGAAGVILYRVLWRHTGTRRRLQLDEADQRWRAAEVYGVTEEPPYPPADRPMMMAPVDGRPPWELAHEEYLPRNMVIGLAAVVHEPKPELVLPDPGGWLSGPCLDVPSPAGYFRGLSGILASTTTNLARDPDDPYDPEEGAPWSVIEPEPSRLTDAGDYLAERTPAAEMWLIRWADRLPSWRIGLEPA